MSDSATSIDATLRVARNVAEVLAAHQANAIVVGAMALAVHNYPRDTVDLDLATAIEPQQLDAVAAELRTLGYEVDVHRPDPDDPLGGVLDVRGEGAILVQVVNFSNPPAGGFPRLVADALRNGSALAPGEALVVTDLITLIAFKLYAGGSKSKLDILELLDRNPDLDLDDLRQRCRSYRLDRDLEAVLQMRSR